jgi:hypothetical protein
VKEFCYLLKRDNKTQCRGRRCLEQAMRIVLFCNTEKTARSTAEKDFDESK